MPDLLGHKFPWGTVTQMHQVSTFTILEYTVGAQWEDAGKVQFQTESAGSCDTLDQALLAALCAKYDKGSTALPYVMRMIQMDGYENI